MIAGGQHITAEIEKFVGQRWGQSETARRIFGVGNYQVNLVSFHQVGHVVMDDLASGAAEDVANKENLHQSLILTSQRASSAVTRKS